MDPKTYPPVDPLVPNTKPNLREEAEKYADKILEIAEAGVAKFPPLFPSGPNIPEKFKILEDKLENALHRIEMLEARLEQIHPIQ